ncbi:MAG: PAS domain S-box protein [Nitrospirae bacterium]|nr:PAS domain S-box protein [Nitrospirota bacterium]
MIPIILFLLSIGLQLAAAVSALLLIRITGRKLAWIFLSLAMALMTSRRILSFVSFLIEGRTITFDLPEVIALIISALMLAGVLRIRTYFHSIRTAEKALRESEERYRILYDNVPTMNFTLDTSGNVVSLNQFAVGELGYQPEELIGRPVLDIFYDEDKPALLKQFGEVLQNPGRAYGWEFRKVHKEGRIVWVREIACTAKDQKGDIVVLVACQDITERRKLEEQLRHMQKMDAIGQFAGGIAHDFNNILTAIVGYGHIALMKMAADDPQRLNIEHMLKAADRAAHLTQNLLVLSRKQIMDRKPVDLNGIIRMVEKLLLRIIGEDIKVETILHEGAIDVFADSGQIEQVLMNLATNARDAMLRAARRTFTIATEVIELDNEFIKIHGYGNPGAYALITVTDTGTGMDEATRERIFEPFFTTKEVGKGTGLGLSIVYGIIKQHDGYINCYSEIGKGTALKIYLPVFKTAAVKEVKPAETVGIPLSRGTETILLAEDEASVRRLIRDVLKESGYKVIEAVDGEEAVSKFMENKDAIDLLLLDVVMPKMSGREAYEIIKKVKPDIKLLMTSGYSADFISKKGIIEEGLNFLAKPMSPANLLKKVREALDK